MRVLLRRYKSGVFFRELNDWTPNPGRAFDFVDKERAIEKARELGEEEVDVVIVHADGTVLFGTRLSPAELAGAESRRSPDAAAAEIAACEISPRPSSILVAEDLESDAKLLRMAFQRAGVSVPITFVKDGAEAIDYLKRECDASGPGGQSLPAMVLLDLKMPRIDGFEVLEWLRGQSGLKRLVVIVLSASELRLDVNRAYDLGANSYLVKPHDFNLLEGLVRNLRQYWLDYNRYPDYSPAAA
jgi:CheY-like chemotaxis protein